MVSTIFPIPFFEGYTVAAQPVQYVRDNTDTKIVVSTIVGMMIFGVITYAAVRSGIKPVAAAARAVK